MRAKITRAQLVEAAQAVRGLVAKDGLSAFSKIRLDVSGCLSVTGSNGDVQVEWRIDGGDILDAGTVTVPGAAFASFAAAMPSGDVNLADSASRMWMEGDGVVFRMAKGDAADYPVMKGPVGGSEANLDAALLKEELRKVMYAVSVDKTRAVLNGVNIVLKDGKLEMSATDGRRVAHVEAVVSGDAVAAAFNFTLPTKAVKTLYDLLGDMDGGSAVSVVSDSSSVRFVGDRFALTAKVAAGVYPNIQQVVPKTVAHEVSINRALFQDALGRAALTVGEANSVKINIGDRRIVFESKSDIASSKVEIACVGIEDGVKAKIRINPTLLMDALNVIDDDDFTFGWDDVSRLPVKLTCSVPYVAAVMPYREG